MTFYSDKASFFLLRRLQDLEGAHQRIVNAHHSSRVLKLPAIVGSRENGHQLSLCEELVAFLDHLMRPADEVDVVLLQKVRHHIAAEDETHASLVLRPP